MTKSYKSKAKAEVIKLSKSEYLFTTKRKCQRAVKDLCDSFNHAMKVGLTDEQRSDLSKTMVDTLCSIASKHKNKKFVISSIKKIANTVLANNESNLDTNKAAKKIQNTAVNLTLRSGRNAATFDIIEKLNHTSNRFKNCM